MEAADLGSLTDEALLAKGPVEGGAYLLMKPARIPFFLDWVAQKLATQEEIGDIVLSEWCAHLTDPRLPPVSMWSPHHFAGFCLSSMARMDLYRANREGPADRSGTLESLRIAVRPVSLMTQGKCHCRQGANSAD